MRRFISNIKKTLIYKDLLVLCFALVWLLVDILIYKTFGEDAVKFYCNTIFVVLFGILTLCKEYNKSFNNWLNKHVWKQQ